MVIQGEVGWSRLERGAENSGKVSKNKTGTEIIY
jgi:hypothetical protein